jgi:DNA ligase (NAD+)
MNRIQELENIISYHNSKYSNGEAEISDVEFDSYVDELSKLDPGNALLLEVGAEPTYGQKVTHSIPMGSLTKITNDYTKLWKWYEEHSNGIFEWSHKVDGWSGELTYEGGKLVQAASRGNGTVGSLLTDNVRKLIGIPIKVNYDHTLAIRGEFYISTDYFNANLADEFSNPRNAVASFLGNDSTGSNAKIHGIEFIAWKLVNSPFKTMKEDEEFINSLKGIDNENNSVVFKHIQLNTGKVTPTIIEELDKKRKSMHYWVDGIVVSINEHAVREGYGYINNKYPKGAVAYKFPAETGNTVLTGIEWSVGRTGIIFPTAILEPVKLDGSMVSRCTLHNMAEINRKGITLGCTVMMEKAGDIIPAIVKVVEPAIGDASLNVITFPIVCPACGTDTVFDGTTVKCTNVNCRDRLIARIVHHLQTLDVKDVGESLVAKIYDDGHLKCMSDLYNVTEGVVATMPNCGKRTGEIFKNAITTIAPMKLDKFLDSLGIQGVGTTVSKILAKRYGTLDNLMKCQSDELLALEGIGDILCRQIMDGLNMERGMIEILADILRPMDFVTNGGGKLDGKSCCCTGELSIKRKELQGIIEKHGGEYSSIKKGLVLLIIGEGAVEAKIEKARKLGAVILDEKQFMELIA